MSEIIVILEIANLVSDTHSPRTADELRSGQGSAMGLLRQESHRHIREFTQVVSDVKRKAVACLQYVDSQTTTHAGGITSQGTKFYNSKVKIIKPGKSEKTLQWDRLPRANHDPEGGYYVFLPDLEKSASNKTSMKMYGSTVSAWTPIFEAI